MAYTQKIASAMLFTVFFVCLFAGFYVHSWYADRMPRAPVPSEGRVYEITLNHGSTRYVTLREFKTASFVLNYGFLVGALCGVGLLFLREEKKPFRP